MGDGSAIAWTDATWNPVTGCSRVSDGCRHCYAEALSLRRGWTQKPWTARNAKENVRTHEMRLDQPLSWRKPRRVFVNSMSDLFHELIPDAFVYDCFAVMGLADQHQYQILTKRPARMRELMNGATPPMLAKRALIQARRKWGPILGGHHDERWNAQNRAAVEAQFTEWPLPHVWLGVSVEDQRAADERMPLLCETQAAVRFVSAEPLLEITYLSEWLRTGLIHWVIVGGESGPEYRDMDLQWAADLCAECAQYGVAFFFKQRSHRMPGRTDGVPKDLMVQQYPPLAGH